VIDATVIKSIEDTIAVVQSRWKV